MRWPWSRKKWGATEAGRERSERLRSGRETMKRYGFRNLTAEQMISLLNYEADEPEEEAGELAREAWGATVIIALAVAVLLALSVLVYVGSHAGAAWQGWRAEPLVSAAEAGDIQKLNALLERGVAPDISMPDGSTALVAATRNGQQQSVETLLAAGAAPSEAAVDVALRYNRREILMLLIEAGANPDLRNSWSHRSLLEIASSNGDRELAELLLEHGADPTSAPDGAFFTPPAIHIALQQRDGEIARMLIEHGTDPTIKHEGWTALEVAQNTGQDELAQMMQTAAGSAEIEDQEGQDEAGAGRSE